MDIPAQHCGNLMPATSVARRISGETGTLRELLDRFTLERGASRDANYLNEYILSHPGVADRATPEGHLTGSILLLDEDKRCLLTLHKKYGTWQQLGGHADGNFDLLAVAAREGLEESGVSQFMIDRIPIDVDIHDAGCLGDPGVISRHFDICFAGIVDRKQRILRSEESLDLRWVPVEEIADLGVSKRLSRLVD